MCLCATGVLYVCKKHVLYYVCKNMYYIHRNDMYDCFFSCVVYCICFFIKHVSNCSHIIMKIMQILCGHHWNHTLFFVEHISKIRNTISRAMFLKSKHLTNKQDPDLTFMFCVRVRVSNGAFWAMFWFSMDLIPKILPSWWRFFYSPTLPMSITW